MGRHKQEGGAREVVPIRLSATERATIKERAGATPESTFIREAALGAGSRNTGKGGYTGPREAPVYTPAGAEGARFEFREADSLITSHNPRTWEPDPRYPRAVQERDYKGDKSERAKVERIAKNPKPSFLLNNVPTAIDGPPVTTEAGVVLGGNGRTMGVVLAYERGTAAAYRAECPVRAPIFGLAATAADKLKRPLLVRVVAGLDGASSRTLADASSRYNEGLGNAMDERAKAVSLSRRLSPETLAAIGAALEEHETLRAALAADATAWVRRLTADGLITAQNRAALVTAGGDLTEAGKMLAEGALLGLVAGTPERLSAAAPATLVKLERLTPALVRVAARANGHDLIPDTQAALDLLTRARLAKLSVADYSGQGSLFKGTPRAAPEAVRLASALEGASARKLGEAAKAWAKLADVDPRQATMFAKPATPAAAREVFYSSLLPFKA